MGFTGEALPLVSVGYEMAPVDKTRGAYAYAASGVAEAAVLLLAVQDAVI
jgi:hypothetical protein